MSCYLTRLTLQVVCRLCGLVCFVLEFEFVACKLLA